MKPDRCLTELCMRHTTTDCLDLAASSSSDRHSSQLLLELPGFVKPAHHPCAVHMHANLGRQVMTKVFLLGFILLQASLSEGSHWVGPHLD